MLGYLFAIIRSSVSGLTTVFNKNYMANTKENKNALDVYMLVLCPIATLFYFIMAGCDASLNMPTFIFSIIYAVVSFLSTVVSMVGYNFATVVYLNVFGMAGPTIIVFFFELIFKSATFSIWEIVSIIVRIMAVCIPLIFNKQEKGMSKKGFLICVAYFIVGGAATIVSQMYVENPDVLSTASLCFWTNVFLMPITFVNIFRKSSVKDLVVDCKKIGLKNYLYTIGNAVVGNAGALLGFEVIRLLGGTISSVITGSMVMLVATFVSAVIYKEKMTVQSWSSIVLSIAAVILSVF